jgi:hypothetical protein
MAAGSGDTCAAPTLVTMENVGGFVNVSIWAWMARRSAADTVS